MMLNYLSLSIIMSTEPKPKTYTNRTVIINSSNILPNSENSKFRYRFNQPIQLRKADKISLASIAIYNSWFNVDAIKYNNHIINYRWFNSNGALSSNQSVTIPDGFYSVDDLNLFLQQEMKRRGHYLIEIGEDGVTQNDVFYITITTNAVQYAVQVYINAVPNTLLDGTETRFIKPSSSWKLPTVAQTPQLVFSSLYRTNELLGFNHGSYPTSPVQNANRTAISQNTPRLNAISALLVTCSLVNNNVMNPSNILTSFSNSGVAFGALIDYNMGQNSLYVSTLQGWFQDLYIEILDQDLKPVNIRDGNILMVLSLLTEDVE